MIKKCITCGTKIPALSCGTFCSPGCRTRSDRREPVAVLKHSKKTTLSDIFNIAAAKDEGGFGHFLEVVQNDLEMIKETAKYYFEREFREWEAERDAKPRCTYCDEIAPDDTKFCSDECEKREFEFEEQRRLKDARQAERERKRAPLLPFQPLKICYHCGSAFKTFDGHQVHCTDGCKDDAQRDRRDNGCICVQCDTRYRMRKYGSATLYRCHSCASDIDRFWLDQRQEKQRQKDEQYEAIVGVFRPVIEERIRSREIRSLKQLKAEQRAKLRHYNELTESIDKGELISVARK